MAHIPQEPQQHHLHRQLSSPTYIRRYIQILLAGLGLASIVNLLQRLHLRKQEGEPIHIDHCTKIHLVELDLVRIVQEVL